jgi:ferredoxin
MNAALYRRIRIVIGALTLGFCTLAFADVGNWLGAQAARVGLWPQFVPSLLSLGRGFGWLSIGCLAVIVLTLVFGRVYCAMLCPLGVLMDFSAWLARRTGKKRKLPYRPGKTWPRALVVAVCIAGLLGGTMIPLAFLDPYSVFGKIVSALLRPPLAWANHLISSTGLIQPVTTSPVSWITAGVALGLLLLVALSAVARGRLWCNTVCPVGAVLGFLSKRSLFRLQIADAACVGCSMCERVCPAQCVDFRNHRIDHSRCVMCLDCVTSCRKSGIHLKTSFQRQGRVSDASGECLADGAGEGVRSSAAHSPGPFGERSLPVTSRRVFFAASALIPVAALGQRRHRGGREESDDECGDDCRTCPNCVNQHNKNPVLPPGAKSLAHFQHHCTACQLCVTNCPEQVLRPSITQHGLAGFLQPYQDFEVGFCSYNCSDCSRICPTGAITPISIEDRKTVRTGKAKFFRGRCVVFTNGTSCGACNEHCPTQAVHMVPWKNGLTIPKVDADLCIGCGGCEYICPVRPNKAIVVDGLDVHERSKPVDTGKKNRVREMEEEFPF